MDDCQMPICPAICSTIRCWLRLITLHCYSYKADWAANTIQPISGPTSETWSNWMGIQIIANSQVSDSAWHAAKRFPQPKEIGAGMKWIKLGKRKNDRFAAFFIPVGFSPNTCKLSQYVPMHCVWNNPRRYLPMLRVIEAEKFLRPKDYGRKDVQRLHPMFGSGHVPQPKATNKKSDRHTNNRQRTKQPLNETNQLTNKQRTNQT